jgi:hypothetical protein
LAEILELGQLKGVEERKLNLKAGDFQTEIDLSGRPLKTDERMF